MKFERIQSNPERCLQCLQSLVGREDLLDTFTASYEYVFKTFKEDKAVLRQMREVLVDQTVYVHGLLVDRTEAGLIQGANN